MVEVWDTLPAALGAPVARHPEADEESGRGLEIIETLAEDWGWETVPGWSGKKVWATLKVVVLLPAPRPREGHRLIPAGHLRSAFTPGRLLRKIRASRRKKCVLTHPNRRNARNLRVLGRA